MRRWGDNSQPRWFTLCFTLVLLALQSNSSAYSCCPTAGPLVCIRGAGGGEGGGADSRSVSESALWANSAASCWPVFGGRLCFLCFFFEIQKRPSPYKPNQFPPPMHTQHFPGPSFSSSAKKSIPFFRAWSPNKQSGRKWQMPSPPPAWLGQACAADASVAGRRQFLWPKSRGLKKKETITYLFSKLWP